MSFQKKNRPQFHFTPAQNWINDPNGLVYYKGNYHLFFQYNPLGDQWGNMSWGHAKSTDLLTWLELPVALPFTPTHAIFSGSVVVDYLNTAGFGSTENPAMVAIFTNHKHDGTHQAQSLAYSTDEGDTWNYYKNNPVLDLGMKNFRDPKVAWNNVNNAWVMSVVKPEEFTVCFYQSQDLKSWELLSEFTNVNGTDGVWECPDFFPLHVGKNLKEVKWVLLISVNPGGVTGGSGTHYFIGGWDGKTFTPDSRITRWIDFGRDNYAGVTWNSAPDNRRIYIGWMNNWVYAPDLPASPSRGSMTIPRELTLEKVKGELVLIQNPVVEIESTKCFDKTFLITPQAEKSGIRFVNDEGKGVEVGYDNNQKVIYLDRTNLWFDISSTHVQTAPYANDGKHLSVRVVLDQGSIELFVDGGRIALTDLLAPSPTRLVAEQF